MSRDVSRAYAFVCDCLREQPRSTPEELRNEFKRDGWNWAEVIRTASSEKVLPTIYCRMESLAVSSGVPQEVKDFFDALQRLSLERNREILAQVAQIGALLNTIGIEPVVLKGGAYLILGLYEDPSQRYLADLDLLVAPDEIMPAVNLLKAHGWEEGESNRFHEVSHQYGTLRKRGLPGVELHRSLGIRACRRLLPAPEVMGRSLLITIGGARIRIPCPEHLVVHHIMHSQVHHGSGGRIWTDLRAMYDLLLMNRCFARQIDWFGIEKRFERHHQSAVLRLHLAHVREVLGLETRIRRRRAPLDVVKRARRKALRNFPALRWIDPVYIFSTVISWRLQVLANFIELPGGLIHVVSTPFRLTFYKNVLAEMRDVL